MLQIHTLHFEHPSNHVPHFPKFMVGGVDTFRLFAGPVVIGSSRNTPLCPTSGFAGFLVVHTPGLAVFMVNPIVNDLNSLCCVPTSCMCMPIVEGWCKTG